MSILKKVKVIKKKITATKTMQTCSITGLVNTVVEKYPYLGTIFSIVFSYYFILIFFCFGRILPSVSFSGGEVNAQLV